MTSGVESAPTHPTDFDRVSRALADGSIDLEGRLRWSSNLTFLVQVEHKGHRFRAVYKPQRGEAPLWDFPAGSLCLREMAAYVLDQALGWHLVPPTVLRDGPFGFGVVQAFVDHDPYVHLLSLADPYEPAVYSIAAFDVVTNNADRKSGHVLRGPDGRLWAIDHGLCFHAEPKLRTVIWHLAGRPLPPQVVSTLRSAARQLVEPASQLPTRLLDLISPVEVKALTERVARLVANGVYPSPDDSRRMVPWPPV